MTGDTDLVLYYYTVGIFESYTWEKPPAEKFNPLKYVPLKTADNVYLVLNAKMVNGRQIECLEKIK